MGKALVKLPMTEQSITKLFSSVWNFGHWVLDIIWLLRFGYWLFQTQI